MGHYKCLTVTLIMGGTLLLDIGEHNKGGKETLSCSLVFMIQLLSQDSTQEYE